MPNFGRLILPLIVITDQFAIISYLEQKPFLLFSPPPSLLVFHSIIKIKISRASTRIGWFRTTPTSIRKYVAKILSQVREKRGASEKKNDFPSYVSWIYRIFFFSISLSRWQSRDRIGKDCEFFFFFTFFISLCLTCTGRTRSQQSVYSWRICRNSATLPCTRSSRNSSSRNGSTPAREAPCTLDRFWNERRRWGRLLIVGNFGLISKSIIGNSNGLKEFMLFAFNITNLIKIWDYNIFTFISNKYNFSKSLYYFWLSLNIIITL